MIYPRELDKIEKSIHKIITWFLSNSVLFIAGESIDLQTLQGLRKEKVKNNQ